jgi:hypothetical protein
VHTAGKWRCRRRGGADLDTVKKVETIRYACLPGLAYAFNGVMIGYGNRIETNLAGDTKNF